EVAVAGLDVEVISTVDGRPIRSFADLDLVADGCDAQSLGSSTLIQYTMSETREPRQFIPVFYARGPKLRNLLVRDDGAIAQPSDLAGKRIGVPSYSNTAAIWIRGVLREEYGVAPSAVTWVEAEPEFVPSLSASIRREAALRPGDPQDRNALITQLKEGAIDAVCWTGGGGYYAFYPGGPLDRFCAQQGGLRSLINDPAVILEYYRRMKLDHITETVAIKRSVAEQEPEAPALILELFRRSAALA